MTWPVHPAFILWTPNSLKASSTTCRIFCTSCQWKMESVTNAVTFLAKTQKNGEFLSESHKSGGATKQHQRNGFFASARWLGVLETWTESLGQRAPATSFFSSCGGKSAFSEIFLHICVQHQTIKQSIKLREYCRTVLPFCFDSYGVSSNHPKAARFAPRFHLIGPSSHCRWLALSCLPHVVSSAP